MVYQLPSHSNSFVEDRFSVCEQYSDRPQVPHWVFIETLLQKKPLRRLEDLLDVIGHNEHDLEFSTLKSVLQDKFSLRTFPVMIKAALRMPELFSNGVLEILTPGTTKTISLTREQIACLLAHMFLCTLKTPIWNKHWCTFGIWFATNSRPAREYLKCLLAYFAELDPQGRPSNPQEEVHFTRSVLKSPPDWKKSTSCFTDDTLTPSLSLHPEPGCNVEVSFANKDVGFGVSGTQEEVKMGMSPEACVVMLLVPTLLDNETLLIRGSRQVGMYEGIGRDVKFIGVQSEPKNWSLRCIIAMDGMEIDCLDEECIVELREYVLLRELNKAYCGFVSMGTEQVTIATGHWGCGAFGGNKYVKSLIQIMAACEANKRLVFHDVTQKTQNSSKQRFLEMLMEVTKMLYRRQRTVGQLYTAITQLEASSSDVFHSIMCSFSL